MLKDTQFRVKGEGITIPLPAGGAVPVPGSVQPLVVG